MNMNVVKAIIFDLDGTLLDTLHDIADSMNTVLFTQGYPIHEVSDYKNFVGSGANALVRRALPKTHQDEATVASCTKLMRQEYAENYAKKTKPYDGIIDLLNELKKTGIQLCVLSNKIDQFTKGIVKKYFPLNYFDIVFGERPNIPPKPDPATAIQIAMKLNLLPHEIIFVGDSGIDMQTAHRAGNIAVGVLWGYGDKKDLISKGAKILLKTPQDLLPFIYPKTFFGS